MSKNISAAQVIRNIVMATGTFALVAGIGGFAGVQYQKAKPHAPRAIEHFPQRLHAIKSQAAQMQAQTLIIGDSLTEFARLPSLCGADVLNAGVSGATIEDTARWSDDLIATTNPKRIIFALGTNNAKTALTATPVSVVMGVYGDMIDRAQKSYEGHDIYIATLPAISTERPNFTASHIEALNNGIRDLAAAKGVKLIELDQHLPMTDGVHLKPEAYDFWRAQMNTACPT